MCWVSLLGLWLNGKKGQWHTWQQAWAAENPGAIDRGPCRARLLERERSIPWRGHRGLQRKLLLGAGHVALVCGADGSGVTEGAPGQPVPKAKQTTRGKGDAEVGIPSLCISETTFWKTASLILNINDKRPEKVLHFLLHWNSSSPFDNIFLILIEIFKF